MRNLRLVLPLLLFSLLARSQDAIPLKMHYKPASAYKQSYSQKFDMVMTFDTTNEQIIKALADKGMTNPVRQSSETLVRILLKTGKPDKQQYFPVIMEYLANEPGEPAAVAIPAGSKIYGKASENTLPAMDSMVAPGLDEATKETVLNTVKSMLSQINIPDKKLKLGDSLTITTPMKLPIGGMALSMNIIATYTLVSLTATAGNFDVKMLLSLDMDINQQGMPPVKGGGDGKGTMVYDRVNDVYSTTDIGYTIRVGMEQNGISMNIVLDGRAKNTCARLPKS